MEKSDIKRGFVFPLYFPDQDRRLFERIKDYASQQAELNRNAMNISKTIRELCRLALAALNQSEVNRIYQCGENKMPTRLKA